MGNFIELCIEPDRIDADILTEMIDIAEGYADNPVLDESDYFEREVKATDDEWEWMTRYHTVNGERIADVIPKSDMANAYQNWYQNYWGYYEPGYIDESHFREAFDSIGVTIDGGTDK